MRRQFGPTPEVEVPVLEYQMQVCDNYAIAETRVMMKNIPKNLIRHDKIPVQEEPSRAHEMH